MALVTMTPGRVGKPCECTIREKTGNVLTHLISYLLHLMSVALWRKPVICRNPYGSAKGPRLYYSKDTERQCEASPAGITCSGASLYCLGDEYMTQGKRTLTPLVQMSLLQHPTIKATTFGERSRPTILITTGWLLGDITRFSNEEYTPSSGWGHYPTTLKVTSLFVSF